MKEKLLKFIKFFIRRDRIKPPQILVLGFGLTIGIGTLLLSLPNATASGVSPGILTALFTATSAVCVTGLVVVDTATYWSGFGHGVILFLIQVGGLGFMTMTTLIFLIAGKRITIKERILIKDSLSSNTLEGVVKFVIYILVFTFAVEAVGALLLSVRFIPEYGFSEGIKLSLFHAISAFCNAGFDLIGDFKSLTPYVEDPVVNFTIMTLIILGGLGFAVINNLLKAKSLKKINLHSKVVLSISAALIVFASVAFFILESGNTNTVGALTWPGKIIASLFMAVTPRTAGFNTLDTASLTNGTLILVMMLMFIGGSPGSTAGGVKTSAFGVVLFSVISILKGRKETEAFGRTIVSDVVKRAIAIIFIGIFLLIVNIVLLTITESASLTEIMFEAISAFGTVGLSMGITPDLTPVGRIIIIITMFVGRVGPLTMAFAIGEVQSTHESGRYKYPEGKILV